MSYWKTLPALTGTLALSLALLAPASPAIAGDERGGEFGIVGGFTIPDENLTGKIDDGTNTDPSIGLRTGYRFSSRWGWYIDGLYTKADSTPTLGDAKTLIGRTGVDYWFNPENSSRWFLTFGGGLTDVDYKLGTDFDYPFASVGFGKRVEINDALKFRWEIRGDQSLDDEGPLNDSITNVHALAAFVWGGGNSGAAADGDGDGVSDRKDDCPGTPRGATVDKKGCPSDADGDGVFDGIDKCADTPSGWPVMADGCPKDSDGDGVVDGKDDCPKTPRGATVNAKGCSKDTDGDGVADGIDKCPNTVKGAKVDATGCAKDSDGDGVVDGVDTCANTPRGAKVDAKGCPTDGDKDGIWDGIDKCPQTPAGVKVDATGCPAKKLFDPETQTLVLEGVNFETNSAKLTPNSTAILDRVAKSLKERPSVKVEVAGYTDSVGEADYNRNLSQRRADSVKRYLVGRGILDSQLVTRGYGEDSPVADNRTREGRAKNRRVELRRLN